MRYITCHVTKSTARMLLIRSKIYLGGKHLACSLQEYHLNFVCRTLAPSSGQIINYISCENLAQPLMLLIIRTTVGLIV